MRNHRGTAGRLRLTLALVKGRELYTDYLDHKLELGLGHTPRGRRGLSGVAPRPLAEVHTPPWNSVSV